MGTPVTVSVIMAVYNGQETIETALRSVLSQKDALIELVVIDGASKDGTLGILRRYADRISVLSSEPDQGIYDALNKGIRLCTGDVIGFLHADDVFADEHVIRDIAKVFASPEVDATYGDLQYVRKDDLTSVVRNWQSGEYSAGRLKRGWMPPHPTFYVRRAIYLKCGLFDTGYRIAADYDCILRIIGRHKVSMCYIPRVLIKMRVGGVSNRSIGNILLKSREDYRALRKNGIGGMRALIWKNLSKLPQFLVTR